MRFGPIPAATTAAVPRLSSAATRFGRLRPYIHRLEASFTWAITSLQFDEATDGSFRAK